MARTTELPLNCFRALVISAAPGDLGIPLSTALGGPFLDGLDHHPVAARI